jgi:hypothetical protein
MFGWIDGWMDGWMDGKMNELHLGDCWTSKQSIREMGGYGVQKIDLG